MSKYSNEDLAELTRKIEKYWEFDGVRQEVRRRERISNFLGPKFPVQVLYRHAKEKWLRTDLNKFRFPFDTSSVAGVFKLNDGWKMSRLDRRYLTDGPLYANDGRTIVVPVTRKWWDSAWVQLLFVLAALASLWTFLKQAT